jgi:translation elongation factor P/translation initiation factor 5A
MSKTVTEIRKLKVGSYVLIDDEPCKIVDYSTSKPGKHGESKARITAVGLRGASGNPQGACAHNRPALCTDTCYYR